MPALCRAQDEAAPARADAEARLHFEVGVSHYETGDYRDAIREFEEAYRLSGRPQLHYNLAACYEHLGELERAAEYLERFLGEMDEAIPNRGALVRRLANLQRRARERADARAAEREAARAVEPVEAEPAAPIDEPAPARSGPARSGPTEEPSRGPDGAMIGAAVGLAVGGLGFVAQGTFGLLALGEDAALGETCGASASCREEDLAEMSSFALASDVGLAVGVAGAAVGLVLLAVGLADDGADDGADEPTVASWLDPHGAGAALRGSF
ncbi:MAG TPA: tetratricopeptide repeat protein [Sandaracinaceae bacterium LLY-WYZ-13_1]|nr:tetratricopeptide repeat protein [Sandaracinaceae bacterium LLY-WYZ-13_1]